MSQVNPERDKISNFGKNEFIIQNLNFYRKQYEQDFKFWEPDPTNQVVYNIIDDGDPPCISNTFEGSLKNLQLLLGSCMALIVKRSWLELANRETKQVPNFIFNDVQTCILL